MGRRTGVALAALAIVAIGGLTYEFLAPPRPPEPPPAVPARWVADQYRRNLGRHMCRIETGEYLGRIEWVGYSRTENTSVYSTTMVGPPRRHEDGTTTYPVRYLTVPVAAVFVTDGKCADGRP